MNHIFKHGRVTILGGTGTLGRALTKELLNRYPLLEITIFSRDEHKQAAMKRAFPQCKYVLGDIRYTDPRGAHFVGRDVVFHVAALKHIDILEDNPWESVLTNIAGTYSTAQLAIAHDVPYFIFSSTDKAVDPINVYGASKMISEKMLFSFNRQQSKTLFSVYRWGNVIGSQGSVIHSFVRSIKNEGKVYLTEDGMSRFWISIDDAVKYMLDSFDSSSRTQAIIPPGMKAAGVDFIAEAVSKILGIPYEIEYIGIRPGEKMSEVIVSQHDYGNEAGLASYEWAQYTDDELIELLTPIVKAHA